MNSNPCWNALIANQMFQAMLAQCYSYSWQYPVHPLTAPAWSGLPSQYATVGHPGSCCTSMFNRPGCEENSTEMPTQLGSKGSHSEPKRVVITNRGSPVQVTSKGDEKAGEFWDKGMKTTSGEEHETNVECLIIREELNPTKGHQDNAEDKLEEREKFSERPESESVLQEQQLIDELRVKAASLKRKLLLRYKKEKRAKLGLGKSRSTSSKMDKRKNNRVLKVHHKCIYPSCTFTTPRRDRLVRHVSTHYPDAYFCPVCHSTFGNENAFDGHFLRGEGPGERRKSIPSKEVQQKEKLTTRTRRKGVDLDPGWDECQSEFDADTIPCVESEDALRYEVGREKERFNFYYLGVLEDFDMIEEHFEMLAGRGRVKEL